MFLIPFLKYRMRSRVTGSKIVDLKIFLLQNYSPGNLCHGACPVRVEESDSVPASSDTQYVMSLKPVLPVSVRNNMQWCSVQWVLWFRMWGLKFQTLLFATHSKVSDGCASALLALWATSTWSYYCDGHVQTEVGQARLMLRCSLVQ